MDELLAEFLTETGEGLDRLDVELVRFEREPNDAETLNTIFRLVHTVKGTCGFLGLTRLSRLAHAAETLMGKYRDGAPVTVDGVSAILASIDRIKQILEALERDGAEPAGSDADLIARLDAIAGAERNGPTLQATLDEIERAWRAEPASLAAPASRAPQPEPEALEIPTEATGAPELAGGESGARAQTVRVSVDTLENLMTTVSELVLIRNQLLDLVRRTGESAFKSPLQRLSTVTAELQEGIMKARMQPIANAWQKLPRLVRELSLELDKNIELDLIGGETELDRQVLELIKDPLTHMVRNSADHGLERPVERMRAGKPQTGHIRLNAYQQGGSIVIEVADDGRGLDAQKIRAKALAAGLATPAELDQLADAEIYKLIFKAGFSTANAVSAVSGRGVGMDVVRNNIELIGGTVELKSTSPAGTSFAIKIPLTLAIMAALIVEAAGQRFAMPQFSVVELVRAGKSAGHRIELINGTPVIRLRDKLLPLLDLAQLLRLGEAQTTAEHVRDGLLTVVVIQIGARSFGVLVDSVSRTEEIVVKPVSSLLRGIGLFSGNTILGDGSVIMIIDPNALAAQVGADAAQDEQTAPVQADASAASENKTALLLFRAGSPSLKAVPLSLITRLEEIERTAIERCNGEDVVQYRGALMPLIHLADVSPDRADGVQPVLVLSEGGRAVGLAVDEIVDIVEERLVFELQAETPGVIGAAIVKGNAVEVIDVSHYLGQGLQQRLVPEAGGEGGAKLLLVDDSQFFRAMLAPLLLAAGYEVTLAGSAQEALALKERGAAFDLIVADLDMPAMDGFALAEQIKADPAWSAVPLIALSSHVSPRLAEKARAAGFAGPVGKFDRQTLMATLEACRKAWEQAA